MSVTTMPQTKSARLFTEVPSEGEDAGNPDAHEDGLALVAGEEPDADTEEETEKRGGDEEVLAFHFILSFGFRFVGAWYRISASTSIDKTMEFKEWLYSGAGAPDNDPKVAARGRFLRLRQEVAEYVDHLAELGLSAVDAREKTLEAFRDRASDLPDEMRVQVEKLITSLTGLLYPHD